MKQEDAERLAAALRKVARVDMDLALELMQRATLASFPTGQDLMAVGRPPIRSWATAASRRGRKLMRTSNWRSSRPRFSMTCWRVRRHGGRGAVEVCDASLLAALAHR
jgi:hypothetical protein